MKKLVLILLSVLLPMGVFAQQQAEYNIKGDDAMQRQDYTDARLWYGEGVSHCDMYSIDQLTKIWQENESMRLSMRSLMNKCLNCLTVKANERDTVAMAKLVVYYTEGIGTPKNKDLTAYWNRQIRQVQRGVTLRESEKKPVETEFFAGYLYSLEAPLGITMGTMFNRMGFYVRFKSNLSSTSYPYTYNNSTGTIVELPATQTYSYDRKKVNYYAVSGGFMVKCTPWLYTSIGAGYFNRELLYAFSLRDGAGEPKEKVWAKNLEDSYKGVIADLDFTVKIGKTFYVSAGCSTLEFKYVDLNVGAGVFF
ncbi:MAG: hypothetical protein LIP06_06900 [Tannerellaceae bacterium]|nr:hypothetical protein [Tannerellaceae bacterium]